jgi:hypothetical protein
VLVAHGTPAGSTLEMIDAQGGKLLGHAEVPGKLAILDARDGRAIWSQVAPDKVYEANLATFTRTGSSETGPLELRNDTLIRLPESLEAELVRCVPEAVKIPSFDGRQLHAFVLRPKQSPPEGQAVAMVRSFYGGDNDWDQYDHILCAAGITVVSPAVRGSSGFGKDFAALNDRDLGGDEIIDLFWVARWIEAQLGIPSTHIGVYGRSHGGYATMRAMTFPVQTNGRNESYAFGFGLAEAGFSDIVAFTTRPTVPIGWCSRPGIRRCPRISCGSKIAARSTTSIYSLPRSSCCMAGTTGAYPSMGRASSSRRPKLRTSRSRMSRSRDKATSSRARRASSKPGKRGSTSSARCWGLLDGHGGHETVARDRIRCACAR